MVSFNQKTPWNRVPCEGRGRAPLSIAILVAAAFLISACGETTTPAADPIISETLDTAATLSATCTGCHATGNPSMIGFSVYTKEGLAARLLEYKTEGGGTVMHRIARGYDDAELAAIANYLGGA